MDLGQITPIVLYDDQCYLCGKFAQMINWLGGGKLVIIGHYSELGAEIRGKILDESALDMFWVITKKRAYGGRAALYPLVKAILSKKTKSTAIKMDKICQGDCKTIKAVFLRSASLLRNSKKIDLTEI